MTTQEIGGNGADDRAIGMHDAWQLTQDGLAVIARLTQCGIQRQLNHPVVPRRNGHCVGNAVEDL